MQEEDVERVIAHPRTMIGSDGLPHDRHPHPRLWGAFPRVLGALLGASAAVPAGAGGAQDDRHDGTPLPASPGAALLRAGAMADVVVFDPPACGTWLPTSSRSGAPRASKGST